jgi:hypothetical protein
MPVDIVTMEDCASNYGVFTVTGSKGDKYTVTFSGSEGPAHCTCPGFKFRQNCKHIEQVYKDACLFNPQWHDAKSKPKLRPSSYTYTQFSKTKCRCGGPMVYVRHAV